MKYLLLVVLTFFSSISLANDFVDELKQIRPRLSYLNLSTTVEGQVGEVKTSFEGFAVSGLYDFSLVQESFYAGLEYSSFQNKSSLSWSNLKLIGGWKYTPSSPWYVIPFVEAGVGVGGFKESGGSFKISDQKGRVFSLEIGGETNLGQLWDKIDGLHLHGSYIAYQKQNHDAFDQTGSTSFKSQGFRLSISYDF